MLPSKNHQIDCCTSAANTQFMWKNVLAQGVSVHVLPFGMKTKRNAAHFFGKHFLVIRHRKFFTCTTGNAAQGFGNSVQTRGKCCPMLTLRIPSHRLLHFSTQVVCICSKCATIDLMKIYDTNWQHFPCFQH